MADMQRADDFVLQFNGYVWTTAGAKFLVVPRNCQIIKVYTIDTVATTIVDDTLTFTNEAGVDLDDTHVIPFTGSAIGRVVSTHFRPNTKNSFAEGDAIEWDSSGGSTVGTGNLTIVCRPL